MPNILSILAIASAKILAVLIFLPNVKIPPKWKKKPVYNYAKQIQICDMFSITMHHEISHKSL